MSYDKKEPPRSYFGHIRANSTIKIARELQAARTDPNRDYFKERKAMARTWGVKPEIIDRIMAHYIRQLRFFNVRDVYFEPSFEGSI